VAGAYLSAIAIEDFSVSGNRTADLAFYTRLNGTFSEQLRIDSSGNVGVNTASPDASFTVDTNVGGSSTGTLARFHASKGESDSTFFQIAATRHGTASVQRVQLQAFDDDGSTGRTLSLNGSGGNVGIGTNSPDGPLHVVSGSAGSVTALSGSVVTFETSGNNNFLSFLSPNAKNQGILFGDEAVNWRGQIQYNHNGNYMAFYTDGADHMRITNVGDIGIGHDGNTSYKLIVQNTANQTTQLNNSTNASFTQDQHIWALDRAGSDAFNFFRLQSGGGSDSEFIFNGAGTAVADGSWTGGGADYAEYFEWADGNSSSQDRVGISVKLDGTKIVASTSNDDASAIIGVISANPSVVGDTAGLKWQSKYERDDYNRYVWEEYTVTEWTVPATETEKEVLHSYQTDKIPSGLTAPDDATVISKDDNNTTLMRKKLNSSFDESVTYVPRSDRKEWDTVGLMGKLRMTKGQKTGANWIKMKDISDTVEEWLVR